MRLIEKIGKKIKMHRSEYFRMGGMVILFLVCGIIQWKTGYIDRKTLVGETDSFYRLSLIHEYTSSKESVLSPFVKLPLGGVWLPGYFSFFVMLKLIGFNDLGLRIVMWICGLLGILMIWVVTNQLVRKFGSMWGFLVMFIFLMSPLVREVNTQMLAEPIMIISLLLSLFLLIKGKNWWSIFFLFLSQTVRYESWFIVPMFWVYIGIFAKNLSIKRKGIMILGTILFPIIWVAINAIRTGEPLFFYTTKQVFLDHEFTSQYSNLWMAMSAWATKLQQYISLEWFWLWVFGIVGIMVCGSRKQKWWGWLSIYSFAMVVVLLWFGSTEWFAPRFIYIVYVLSVPVILMAIEIFSGVFNKTDIFSKLGILLLTVWMLNQYIQGIPTTRKNVYEYFAGNQEIKVLTDKIKNETKMDYNKKTIYLWLNDNYSHLWVDFDYYLIKEGSWENLVIFKNYEDLKGVDKNVLIIDGRNILTEAKGFSDLLKVGMFSVWYKK